MEDPRYKEAHEELAPEFELAHTVIDARVRAESGRRRPSTQTLERLAEATGTRLKISFEPAGGY